MGMGIAPQILSASEKIIEALSMFEHGTASIRVLEAFIDAPTVYVDKAIRYLQDIDAVCFDGETIAIVQD